jgi:Sec-independent protein translocase protein TatA
MFGDIFGGDGIIVLVVVVALLFGGAAIPKLARGLGSAKNEFEAGLKASKNPAPPSAPQAVNDQTAAPAPPSPIEG